MTRLLEELTQILKSNKEISVVGIENVKVDWENYSMGLWGGEVRFFVAPKNGIYNLKNLEKLGLSLIPKKFEPYVQNRFWDSGEGSEIIEAVGDFCVNKVIGLYIGTKTIVLTEKDSLTMESSSSSGVNIKTSHEPIKCRIWVSLYPDKDFAKLGIKEFKENGRWGRHISRFDFMRLGKNNERKSPMEYFVTAHDGGTRGSREVGRFSAQLDREARQIFEERFKNKKKHDPDGLDLYRVDDSDAGRRYLIEYRSRLITKPL